MKGENENKIKNSGTFILRTYAIYDKSKIVLLILGIPGAGIIAFKIVGLSTYITL